MQRTIKKARLQQTKTGQYTITVPHWIVDKVLLATKGTELEWDFQGETATIRKVK